MIGPPQNRFPQQRHRGFTLMEALMAAAILLAGVLAVFSAISVGQEQALQTQQRMVATFAADELMGRIMRDDYGLLEDNWVGFHPAGEFLASVGITDTTENLPGGLQIRGRLVSIQVLVSLADPTVLSDLSLFIAEPPS